MNNVDVEPDSSSAVRFGFEPADQTARVIVTFPDTGSVVSVCALASPNATVPASPSPQCLGEIASGVREEIGLSSGLGGVAFWVRRGRAVRATIRVEFAERTRAISLRLPAVAPVGSACSDNACNPVIEVRPVRGGRFSASASWSGGRARFALLEGRVLGRSFTATGVPYAVPAEQTGNPPLSLATRLSAPAEYALIIDRNDGALRSVAIDMRWP